MKNIGREYIIKIENISKSFPGVQALDSVSLNIISGEIHVLIGENGAGKSTLIKILTGVYQKDSGKIEYKGKEVNFQTPRQAMQDGISVIHQELSLILDLTVADNIFLGREKSNGQFLQKIYMQNKSKEILDSLELDIDPSVKVKELSNAQRQMVEIARSVSWGSSLVIMDEPTSSLSEKEVKSLFKIIKKLKRENVGIIYISHRLKEIPEIGDRVTVLRDGKIVQTLLVRDSDEKKLISLMVGREIKDYYHLKKQEKKEKNKVLEINNLTLEPHFRNISFYLNKGEILGISGLIGAGRTELLRAIFGLDQYHVGEIILKNNTVKFNHPKEAIDCKIGLITEDRRDQGLLLDKSVVENISLPVIRFNASKGFINKEWEKIVSSEFKEKLKIRTPSINTVVKNLSGGNQQKVIIARWLAAESDILLLDEPTRGIDVNAKAEIYALMIEFVHKGGSIIMVSSELPEILGLAHRIIVMRKGELTGILSKEEATEERVMNLAALK
jgi:ribose transport system ATP-binding protein